MKNILRSLHDGRGTDAEVNNLCRADCAQAPREDGSSRQNTRSRRTEASSDVTHRRRTEDSPCVGRHARQTKDPKSKIQNPKSRPSVAQWIETANLKPNLSKKIQRSKRSKRYGYNGGARDERARLCETVRERDENTKPRPP